jgi:transcriptional regulator with XRE-family HTH domain
MGLLTCARPRTSYTAGMTLEQGRELKTFLRAMRARLEPGDVGLPPLERRRRRPGLRIEEAASLAGVSLTWYSAFEGGKGIRVSADVLERIAAMLRLSPAERRYLSALAAPKAPSEEALAAFTDAALAQRIVDGFTLGPAFVADPFWTVSAFNPIADAIYGFSNAPEANLLVRMFVDPGLRALHVEWERIAMQMTAIFRDAFGDSVDDARAHLLVARLRETGGPFAVWWDSYTVRPFVPTPATLAHPELGTLTLIYTSYVVTPRERSPDRTMLVIQTAADEITERLLAALSARVSFASRDATHQRSERS